MMMKSDKYQLIIGALHSKLTIECEAEDENLNLATLKNIVESTVRIVVDSVGYSTACGFDVEIESAYNSSKKEITMFGVQEEIFNSEEHLKLIRDGKPPTVLGIDSKEITSLMGIDVSLRLAMADFRESIRNPDVTAFHCMRAIESLKHSDFFGNTDGTQKLEQLKNSIKLSKKTHNKISMPGNEQRHGKPLPQSWENRKEQMLITWEVIRRYILLRLKHDELAKLNSF
jgi:hypothetical protein